MWRYLAGGTAVIAVIVAGFMVFSGDARPGAILPPQPVSQRAGAAEVTGDPLPASAPEATDRTREQKRFDRYDKDRDAKITREEYLVQRRKTFARLDTDGDGKLSFEEWAVKAAAKFAEADRDKSGAMTAAEFATTAVKRKGPSRLHCPPVQAAAEES